MGNITKNTIEKFRELLEEFLSESKDDPEKVGKEKISELADWLKKNGN